MVYQTGQVGQEIVYNRGALNAKQAIVNQIDRIGCVVTGSGDYGVFVMRYAMAVSVLEAMLVPLADSEYSRDLKKIEPLSKSRNINEQLECSNYKFQYLMKLLDRNNLWLESSEYEEIGLEDETDAKSTNTLGQKEETVRDGVGSEEVREQPELA